MAIPFRQAIILAGILVAACYSAPEAHRNAEAEARMAAFLQAGVITQLDSTHTVPDTLIACPIESASDPYKALAWSRILTSSDRGDTVDVSAEIVTVGSLSQVAEGGYVMRLVVATDTLHWPMVRDSVTKQWGACGFPREGYDFMRMIVGSDARWDPPSGSWRTVAAMADSVRSRQLR